MLTVNYTKAQYQAKISELEGYITQLETHLNTMNDLKQSMYQFWDDPNGREAAKALATEIRQVRNAMTRTQDMLTFYKSTVEKLDGTNLGVKDVLESALGVLGGLGI